MFPEVEGFLDTWDVMARKMMELFQLTCTRSICE